MMVASATMGSVTGCGRRKSAAASLQLDALKTGEAEGIFHAVRFGNGLVGAHAQHPGEAHGDSGLVAVGALDTLEAQLEHELGLHDPDRAEALDGVPADE